MAGTSKRAIALLSGTTALIASAVAFSASAQVTLLDPITIIATRTEEYAIDTLAPVSVIRGNTVQQLNSSRIGDVFFGVPGVTSASSAQEGSTSINIRGLQDWGRVNVVIDGARQNYARIGHTSGAGSFFLDPELIGGVDIVRGPSSNIFGSGAIGGVVQFRTKDVEDILAPDQLYGAMGTLSAAGGSAVNTLASLFAASRVNPNVDFMFGAAYRQNDVYKSGNGTLIPNSDQNSASLLSKTTFRPADGHAVKFSALLQENDWKSGPPVTGASGIVRGWGAFNSTVSANYRYSKPEDRLFDFSGTLYWNRTDVDSTTLAVNPGFTGFYGPVGNRANYLIDTLGFDASNTARFDTGAFRHAFTYGGDLFKDDVQNRDPAGFGAGYNPRGERQIYGGFLQLKSNYSTWLETITAIRYDNYSLNGNHYTTGAPISSEGDRLSPKFTLGITPITGFQVYGTYAEGYRAPAVTETIASGQHPIPPFQFIPNPALRPEIGKTAEIGFNIKRDNWLASNDALRIKANYFENRVDDFIEGRIVAFAPFSICPVPPFCSQFQNIPRAKIDGFEFEANYDRGDWFAGLSGHVIRGGDLTNGDPLNNIPPDMVAMTFGFRAMEQRLVVALRWAAYAAKKREDLPANDLTNGPSDEWATAVTGSYNLVNLYMSYDVNPGLTAFLNAQNLLNEQYRQYNYEYAAAGVTVWAGIKYRFGAQTASQNVQAMLNTQNQTRNLRASGDATVR